MADRDVTIDIVGRDRTDAATKSAIRNFQNLQKEQKANEAESDKLRAKFGQWEKAALSAAKAAAAMGARVAGIASLVSPATTAVTAATKGVIAFGKGAAVTAGELAPLVAYVPALVGSLGLLVTTTKIASSGLQKALKPITDAFAPGNKTGKGVGSLTTQIQNLASRGVSELAKQFVKVNLPTVAAGMDRIAVAENKVVVAVGKWVNSAPGQSLVRQIVGQTATFAEQLGPHFSNAVIAVANLARQATGLNNVGSAVGKILDKFTNWANSIDGHDINAAFATILRGWADIRTAWGNLKSVVAWMDQNRDKIKEFSSALAGIGVVFGLATGDLPAAAAGAFTLVFQNIDKIKGSVKGFDTKPWVTAFDNVRDASKNVLGIGKDIVSTFGPLAQSAIGPATGALKDLSGALKSVFDFADKHQTTFQAIAVGLAAAYTWTKLLAIQEWALTTAQVALDVAMDANPIGLVVIAIVALAAAFAYLWTHSAGFRDFFIGMWNAIWGFLKAVGAWFAGPFAGFFVKVGSTIKSVFEGVSGFINTVFAQLVRTVLNFVGAIIDAAAKAFGWVPGLGPKLKNAAKDFDSFRDKVNASLSGIKDKTVNIHVYKTGNGATLIDNQGEVHTVGNRNIAVASNLSWAPANTAAQFMTQSFSPSADSDRGGSRIGGPAPVHAEVHNEVTVLLDGRPVTTRIKAEQKRADWRQKVGRR